MLVGVGAVVAMFLILVVPHEFGHFALAKIFGIKVHEYSIGIGSRLAWFRRGDTLYALRALPIGGFVRLAGMEPGDFADPRGFHHKPAWQKLLVLGAGAGANFLVAALIMTAVNFTQVFNDPQRVRLVLPDSPAAQAGIRPGDVIQSVNGTPMEDARTLRQVENSRPGEPLQLEVRRPDGSTFTARVTPVYNAQDRVWQIGVQIPLRESPLQALRQGLTFPLVALALLLGGLFLFVSGQVPGGLLGPQGATGAVGIGALTYQAANDNLLVYLGLVSLLSVAIGFTNLLPIPALDGGRIVVVLLERLRGRPFDRERELAVQRAGLVALLALMALIALLDIERLATGQFGSLR